ncbi:MAG: hypothetical protein ACR2LC_14260 [Pyrinomonadaceae bacterium]
MNKREGKHSRAGARLPQQPIDSLAENIAGILSNPETPVELYNSTVDYITSYEGKVIDGLVKTPEFIKRILKVAAAASAQDDNAEDDDDAENGTPAPKADSAEWEHHPAFRRISNERAAQLTDIILSQDDDEQARAFVELIAAVAYERDFAKRDDLTAGAISHAFSLTMECSRAVDAFCATIRRD